MVKILKAKCMLFWGSGSMGFWKLRDCTLGYFTVLLQIKLNSYLQIQREINHSALLEYLDLQDIGQKVCVCVCAWAWPLVSLTMDTCIYMIVSWCRTLAVRLIQIMSILPAWNVSTL